MRAIVIMYDSLNRKFLEAYGNKDVIAPNFARLAKKSVVFDNFFAGSLPCMPARRELHTGRINFLHRGWGPLEPCDVSCPKILSSVGVHSHLITDHLHYWQDGGLNYHTKFSSYEFVRGQEGDWWKADSSKSHGKASIRQQDEINREYLTDEKEHYHAVTNSLALEFLNEHKAKDNWFLQVEYFDPHEPFFVPERFKKMYSDNTTNMDWPPYEKIDDKNNEELDCYKNNYKALITMCDEYLGKVLDVMDENDMWKDTMLIVNTDHGYLIGDHGFYAKNYMPCYDEIAHTPFFMSARGTCGGTRTDILAQTVDIPATLLDYFNVPATGNMEGKSLLNSLQSGEKIRDYAMFGLFGRHANITDGRYVFMKAAANEENSPLNNYTLIPSHLNADYTLAELRDENVELVNGFPFTNGVPMLKIPASNKTSPDKLLYKYSDHYKFGDMLFDLKNDPNQENNLIFENNELALKMKNALIAKMKENDAPLEQFVRLGLVQ